MIAEVGEPIAEEGDDEFAALLRDAVEALDKLLTAVKVIPPRRGWTYSEIGHVESAHGLLRHKGGV